MNSVKVEYSTQVKNPVGSVMGFYGLVMLKFHGIHAIYVKPIRSRFWMFSWMYQTLHCSYLKTEPRDTTSRGTNEIYNDWTFFRLYNDGLNSIAFFDDMEMVMRAVVMK